MFPVTLLTTFILIIPALASPVEVSSSGISLPLAKRVYMSGDPINLAQRDRAHVTSMNERATSILNGNLDRRDISGATITQDDPSTAYIASVGVGSPPTTYNLLVQLGTANTWIGHNKPYKKTETSKDTNQPVGLYVTGAFFTGEEWLDTVSFSSDLVIHNQSIGVASQSSGYAKDIDGVLGLAPTYLTVGTLWSQPLVIFPTVTDNLYNQGTIPADAFSFSFSPHTGANTTTGELIFGGADPSKHTGQINYVPITTTLPASYFWGIDLNITYGDTMILSQGSGVVEPSVSLNCVGADAYNAYKNAIGATEDEATSMLKLTSSQYENLQNLNFQMGPTTYALTPNGQIWPRVLNSYIGGSNGGIYCTLIKYSFDPEPGHGFDFTLGQSFLERFYSVFDTTRNRIGFATTIHTDATTN